MREENKPFYEISDYLNNNGYTPQRTSKFTPENVFGIYSKMSKRVKRLQNITPPIFSNFGIITEKIKI